MKLKRKRLLFNVFLLSLLTISIIIILNSIGSKSSEIKFDSYQSQKKVKKINILTPIKTKKEIYRYLIKGVLVKVEDNPGFKVNKLLNSKPVLTKGAYVILKIIGLAFQEAAGTENYFVVTSLTRTLSDQKILTKHNINATKNISAHSYGASFDISYVRFNGKKEDNYILKTKLGEILSKLEKKGKIYVKKERKVACFHITSRI